MPGERSGGRPPCDSTSRFILRSQPRLALPRVARAEHCLARSGLQSAICFEAKMPYLPLKKITKTIYVISHSFAPTSEHSPSYSQLFATFIMFPVLTHPHRLVPPHSLLMCLIPPLPASPPAKVPPLFFFFSRHPLLFL